MIAPPRTHIGRDPNRKKKTVGIIPVIDLSLQTSDMIVKACQELGFFKVTNHAVPKDVVVSLEREAGNFFAQRSADKRRAGPPNPFGYGCKNIGLNGDTGEVEYLLLHSKPGSVSTTISDDAFKFSSTVNDYMRVTRDLACEILELVADGLGLKDRDAFSNLVRGIHSDSLLRINHYLPVRSKMSHRSIGFGEHSDPQLLTILRSNDVGGLQIMSDLGTWLPVPPDPDSFFVLVGDLLQVLTNGRFKSVRHQVKANTALKPRLSFMYFAAPPLDAILSPPAGVMSVDEPRRYRTFSWEEYKTTTYSLRLGLSRLQLFTSDYSGLDKHAISVKSERHAVDMST